MIKQMFKIVWNRKRSNILIIIEIFFTFMVLMGVLTTGVYFLDNHRMPLGFSYNNVWDVNAVEGEFMSDDFNEATHEKLQEFMTALTDFDEIVNIGALDYMPFSYVYSGASYSYKDKEVSAELTRVTDGVIDVFRNEVIQGRWFNRSDDASSRRPVIINRYLREELFGDIDPIDKIITTGDDEDITEYIVVGVVSDFRKNGELAGKEYFILERRSFINKELRPPRNFVFTVRPGTTAEFEERIVKKLQAMAPGWSFTVNNVEERHKTTYTRRMIPYAAFGIISLSMMLMVGLGLMGVLWQTVTRRTREIGLRRAKGAAIPKIHNQILGELFMITSIGVFFGVILGAQFPILQLIPFFSSKVWIFGMMLSAFIVYALTLVCGLYPSYMATKIQPAEALRYE